MAALCPGVKYDLSSQQNFGENKDLIFVKLTDSALRAVEDHIKNQNKLSCQSPTIKFLNNGDGELSFPSIHHSGGSTSFSFKISSTADMEGPGGSFECVQHVGSPRGSLEGLGSIPFKMRIIANEDVYEVTRNRMTEAEDKYKNKCTREIKPNQTDIGRKVKIKQTQNRIIPPVRKEMPSMRDSLLKQPSSYQQNLPPSKPAYPPIHSSSTNNGLPNGLSSNYVSSSRPQLTKSSLPDIAKRPLKERLIQLLALKPFRKMELFDRLQKEGLRKEKTVSSILKQISSMHGNCYHLNRSMWNEVQEDWPFYSESEKQMLKRRKPQNLTPPGSSDGGSSGSGQSPTSTHPGSPPQITSTKRPGFYDGADGIPTKRQRVSHYRKPQEQQPAYRSPVQNNSQRRPMTDSRDASNMNPRSRESPTNGYFGSSGYVNGMLNEKRNLSDDEDNATKKRSCDSHSLSFGVHREKTVANSRSPPQFKIAEDSPRKDVATAERNGVTNGLLSNGRTKPDENRIKYNSKVTSSTQNRISRVSPDSQTEPLSVVDVEPPPPKPDLPLDDIPIPDDYRTQYLTIRNNEQRRRYKADFNADYKEYKELHGIVEKVSSRFVELDHRLKQAEENSPKYKEIKKQIVREYQENKKDLAHQKAKRRFQYLHNKLSHIKQLVIEYDQAVADSQH